MLLLSELLICFYFLQNDWLALNYACFGDARLEDISSIIDANLDAVTHHDKDAKVALHHLCANTNMVLNVVELLFCTAPDTMVNYKDADGKTALNYLWLNKHHILKDDLLTIAPGDFQQLLLQLFAQHGEIDLCSLLIENGVINIFALHMNCYYPGAGVDVGWDLDARTPRLIGQSHEDKDVQTYFMSVQRLFGRYKISRHPRHASGSSLINPPPPYIVCLCHVHMFFQDGLCIPIYNIASSIYTCEFYLVSETCCAIGGKEIHQGIDVMLKFMTDEDAFRREIDKRLPMKDGTDAHGNCCVISILEHHELEPDALAQFKQVELSGCDAELKYLIVMPLGVEDLSDEISHSNFAGVDKSRSLAIAASVAESLCFLNEGCGVMHGALSPPTLPWLYTNDFWLVVLLVAWRMAQRLQR